MRKAAFFDRDGTINEDIGYLHRKEDLLLIPQTVELIKHYNEIGWPVVVISNQSGIARGMFSQQEVDELHSYINKVLEDKYEAHIDAFYICPHLPEITGECDCRKPKPGMFIRAAKELDLDLSESVSYGDSERDEIASKAAGIKEFHYIKKNGITESFTDD